MQISNHPFFFLAVERRPEGLGEKWHQLGVLSAPLEMFGFCTLEVTPSGCQTPLKAEDGIKHGREVPRQSSSDSSFFPFPLLIFGSRLMTPPGTERWRIEPVVFTAKMTEKCLLGHINLSKEQLGLPERRIIVKKPEILRRGDYESSAVFTVQAPVPCFFPLFLSPFPMAGK